jgi:RNA polymerase sigma factor (sigma-70 family)
MNKARIADANNLPTKTVGYINAKARKTSFCIGLGFEDEEDLRQSLFLAAIKARDSFNAASRAAMLETYLHRAVDNAAVDFLRRRSANIRTSVLCILDAPLNPNGNHAEFREGETMIDFVADRNADTAEDIVLRIDVADAIKPLDRECRELCDLLMRGVSIRECARIMELPLWDVRRRLMPKIADSLEELASR